MATNINVLASGTTITQNSNSTTVTYNPVGRADIFNRGVEVTYSTSATIPSFAAAIGRVPSNHVTNPGVFTLGTVPEGTLSNTTNDSNA